MTAVDVEYSYTYSQVSLTICSADNPGLVTIPMSDAITLAGRWNERIYGEALKE